MGTRADYPVRIEVEAAPLVRNRLTVAFRPLLAIPHLILVGGPLAAVFSWTWRSTGSDDFAWSAGGGVLGAVAVVTSLIAWVAIVFTGRCPPGLWGLAAFYLRWRVRVAAYVSLLRDEYPPFGDAPYPVELRLSPPPEARDRLAVAFRIFLVIPQLITLWAIGLAWAVTTLMAWVAILFTGRFPASLYRFATGALRWSIRVEAYLLLLVDDYPPFSLD